MTDYELYQLLDEAYAREAVLEEIYGVNECDNSNKKYKKSKQKHPSQMDREMYNSRFYNEDFYY